MAIAQAVTQPLYEKAALYKARKVAANTTVWPGTLAMNDAGVIKVFTAAGVAAGAKLLGFPVSNVSNATGSTVTETSPYAFRRGCPMSIAGKAGDLPTESDVGGTVYLKDNFAIGKTMASGDVAVTLLESTETSTDGNYLIMLP